ncbi:MAG: serine/threonine protein kinase [Candidatus Bathyarchaeota archaeon]|nr:serine/threonine protein kinase [Candidatus Termiticorpusculum sp.]
MRGKKVSASVRVSVENLVKEPYASVLCYPRAESLEVVNRILELKELGVDAVEFVGSGLAANVSVLGKGYVGVVVVAYVGGERLALKMRRLDGGRDDFFHEAEMLQKANAVGVGPRFVAVSKNFLLSELVVGDFLVDWMGKYREKVVFQRVVRDVLEQCWRLDEAGLDHGELSNAPRHLLVDNVGKLFIVDFESASVQRRVANVTSVCQYLFVGNSFVSRLVWEVLGDRSRCEIVELLRFYKKMRSRVCFEALLQMCV